MGISAWPADAEGPASPKQRLIASVDIRKEGVMSGRQAAWGAVRAEASPRE